MEGVPGFRCGGHCVTSLPCLLTCPSCLPGGYSFGLAPVGPVAPCVLIKYMTLPGEAREGGEASGCVAVAAVLGVEVAALSLLALEERKLP